MSESAAKQTAESKSPARQSRLQAEPGRVHNPASTNMALASVLGNRTVTRLNQSASSRDGSSGDPLEQEADHVARQVMSMTFDGRSPARVPMQVQRKCRACEDEEKRVQRKAANREGAAPSCGGNGPSAITQGGRPLEPVTRGFFESRFGQNFEQVRVHTDTAAARSARTLNARAYTVGQHISFAEGEYRPETPAGGELLAHELTHVLQQRGGIVQPRVQKKDDEERAKLSQELIPTATFEINLDGVFFTVNAEATFQPGPKTIQLIRITLKTLLGDQYSDDLAVELTKLLESKKAQYLRYGHFKDTRDAYPGEKISGFGFGIDPFLVITRFLEAKKLKVRFDDTQWDQLRAAFASKSLWADIVRIAHEEGMPLPAWYGEAIFKQQLASRMEDLGNYKQALFEYMETGDKAAKESGLAAADYIFWDVYEEVSLLEAMRKDTALFKDLETQPAYQAIWFLTDKQRDKGKPAAGLRSLKNTFALLEFSKKYPDLRRNFEVHHDARRDLLLKFIGEKGIEEDNLKLLPPYPAFIVSPDLNADNTTVDTASNTFRMVTDTTAVHGNDLLYGVAIAMARSIFYSWKVTPLPDSLKYMHEKTDIAPADLAKEADDFVKNSPQNVKDPVKEYSADRDYEQPVDMGDLGIGDYLLVGHAQPQYRADMHWIQEPSTAGYPFFVYDAEALAHNTAYADWDRLSKLREQQAKADPEDRESYQDEIDRLEKRESGGLLALTRKDTEDTQKLLDAAQKLKLFIEDDRRNKTPARGNATTDPFIVRLKKFDPALHDVYMLIREMYDPRQYDDIAAIDEYIGVLENQKKELEKLGSRVDDAYGRFKPGAPVYRVVAALVKEDDGNAVPLMLVAGYHPDADPKSGKYKIKLVDVTFDSPKKGDMIYVGDTAGNEKDAVQNAFVKFGEDNHYGNGKIVYRLPQTPYRGTADSITTFFEYLEYALAALGLILLVAGTIASFGTLSPVAAAVVTALGVSLAVVGAAMSIRNMARRKEKGTLEMDSETALDIINIIGAVVVVVGTVTKVTTALRATTLSRVLMIQRLEKLIAVYDITELGANIYLISAKVKEDIDAIKKLGLPKEQEDEMIASVTFDAIQQGAMMAVSAYSTMKQIPETYRSRVEGSSYASWEEKGWIRINEEGVVEITDSAPPFLRESRTKVGSVDPEQQGDLARKAVVVEPVVQKPTKDGQHQLTLTEHGRIIRCSDLCQDLRARYQKVLEQDPEMHRQLLAIEEKAAAAAGKGDKVLAGEALAEATELEEKLRWADDQWKKFTGAGDTETDAALDAGPAVPGKVTGGAKSGYKIEGVRIPDKQRRRIDVTDLMTEQELAGKGGFQQALMRLGNLMGKRVSDVPVLKKHWDAAVTDVLKGKPVTDYSRETVNGELYPKVNRAFWKRVARDPEAVAFLNENGFSIGRKGGAPLADLGPTGKGKTKGTITDQERRVSLDHVDEKAQGDNWQKALDPDNLEFMFQNANSEKEIVQVRHKLRGASAAPAPAKTSVILTPEERRLATHGKTLGMLDTEVDRFIEQFRALKLPVEDMERQMDQWGETLKRNPKARARIAPDFILDPASRARLPDFEHKIAGTGGIEKITVRDAPNEGGVAVTIEGVILPGRLTRRKKDVTATRRRAPDFNRSDKLFSVKEAGLDKNWQRLHLWGPGFGDEAAAGMMWGPRKINLDWQNESIESYIRDLAILTERYGGRTRLKATAISWENPTPSGWKAPQGENFLKRAEYVITLERPNQPDTTIRITLDITEPPKPGVAGFDIDPPHAVNLGDLFP